MHNLLSLENISFNNKNSCFYIKKSNICKGYGLFANTYIPKGKIITYYYGYIKSAKLSFSNIENKYAIEFDNDKSKRLIGINNIKKINKKGAAQIVNDAICPYITNETNNACFINDGKYIYLKSIDNINKNDEILASYGIDYWKNEIKINRLDYNVSFINKINYLYHIIKIIEKRLNCEIMDCIDFKDNHVKFRLLNDKILCKNINNYHKENEIYIYIKKDINKKIYYYNCKKCLINDLIIYTEINKLFLH